MSPQEDIRMALEIIYEELVKDFRVEGNRLFRLNWSKTGEEREIIIKDNCNGYCVVRWKNKLYRSHRLMYCLYNKVDVPTDLMIDHKKGSKINNSEDNLHLVTVRGNSQNLEVHRNGKLVGANFIESLNKYQSQIYINNKKIHLGYYQTELEAHETYLTALTMLDKPIAEIKTFFGIRTKDKCTSKYRGVSLDKSKSKWKAQLTINGIRKHLGYFETEDEAYEAIVKSRTL